MQFYDPNTLIEEVQELLRSRGVESQLGDGVLAQTGACMLIRALGATPAIGAVDAYARALDAGYWPDADDRRAAG
jgi:hypothetical protein